MGRPLVTEREFLLVLLNTDTAPDWHDLLEQHTDTLTGQKP
jgi:hypothetical protein